MFHKIDHLVKKQLNKVNLGRTAQSAYICRVAEDVLEGKYKIISYLQGVLTIAVKNNYQAMQIQAEKTAILKKINLKLGQQKITAIKFRL